MVTASHNPARTTATRSTSAARPAIRARARRSCRPRTRDIEAAIEAAPAANRIPLSERYRTLEPSVVDAYLDAVVALSRTPERDVSVAYSPLHGVGARVLLEAFRRAGFAVPSVVEAQVAPDPDFPTVAFPNPEEPGAMDHLFELARDMKADLAIANDPDADRCAVAAGTRMLTGDELGLLLADHVLRHLRSGSPSGRPLVATSLVSSSALPALAKARGATAVTTLTGFKWLARAGGAELVYAYEEALGYAVGLPVVRDKDGISAALAVAELAASLKARGLTLLDRLDELTARSGCFPPRTCPSRSRTPTRRSR